ncbi:ArdC family protein [Hominenteromicrobium sp.]|uniref:ArdC family protein n=1 Tax=Hominenteromicrobium sp. TaxID=3073581 RepID=UPI003AB5BA6F
MKQAEREEVWSRVSAQAESVFKDDDSLRGFLHFMADCTPQKTSNLLLLYAQNPEITHPRTFDKWKEAGRSIRSGEKGYTFYADQEYTKEDGTRGIGSTITKAYDIAQTRGPQPLPPQQHLPEEVIAAMIENSPVPLVISDQLPQGVQAQYVPRQRTIFVRNGMMKPPPSAPSPASRPTPTSTRWAVVTIGRRMRLRLTAQRMWLRRNSALIPLRSILTRCAKAIRK